MSEKSNISIFNVSEKSASRIAGFSLLLMTIAAILAYFMVFQKVYFEDSAMKTYNKVVNSGLQFVISIAGLYLIVILDFIVAWALYIYFKPVNSLLSSIAASMRIIYGFIFAYAIVSLAQVTSIISSSSPYGDSKLVNMMNAFKTFESTWQFGYFLFGLHLILLGVLALRSPIILKIIGVFLIISGLGYFIDTVGYFFIEDYNLKIAEKVFYGEMFLMIWLIIDGFRKKSTFASKLTQSAD